MSLYVILLIELIVEIKVAITVPVILHFVLNDWPNVNINYAQHSLCLLHLPFCARLKSHQSID